MKRRWKVDLSERAVAHLSDPIALATEWLIQDEALRGPKSVRYGLPRALEYQWDEDLPTEGVHQLAVLLAALSFAGDSSSNVIAQAVKKLEAHLVQEEDRMAAVARMRAHARALRAAAEHKRRYLVDFLRHIGIQVPKDATHKEATQFVKDYAHLVSFHVRMSCLSPMARAYLAESKLFRKYGIRE